MSQVEEQHVPRPGGLAVFRNEMGCLPRCYSQLLRTFCTEISRPAVENHDRSSERDQQVAALTGSCCCCVWETACSGDIQDALSPLSVSIAFPLSRPHFLFSSRPTLCHLPLFPIRLPLSYYKLVVHRYMKRKGLSAWQYQPCYQICLPASWPQDTHGHYSLFLPG